MRPLFTLLKASSLLIFFLYTIQPSYAQGNLRFSQVKYIILAGTGSSGGGVATQTLSTQALVVPANHVLKIENMSSLPGVGGLSITIDDIAYGSASFPFWLPAGNYTVKAVYNTTPCFGCGTTPSCATSFSIRMAISSLDFEVVP